MKTVVVTLLTIAASSEAILPLLIGKKLGLLSAGSLAAGVGPRIYHERYYEPYYPVRHYPLPVQNFRRVDYAPPIYTSSVSHPIATNFQPVGQPLSVVETVQPSDRYPTYTHVDTRVENSAATVYKVSVPVTYTDIVQGPTHHTATQYSNTYVEPAAPRGRYVNGVWCEN